MERSERHAGALRKFWWALDGYVDRWLRPVGFWLSVALVAFIVAEVAYHWTSAEDNLTRVVCFEREFLVEAAARNKALSHDKQSSAKAQAEYALAAKRINELVRRIDFEVDCQGVEWWRFGG